ncbi:MAG: MOSC N-terminal beta barrel domain-containing protein [Pseudomonadota bacterium]
MFIESLFIYPLKGARGIQLQQSDVTRRGLAHDRTLMLVDDTGNFVSQRNYAVLATITSQLDATGIIFSAASHPDIHVAWSSFTEDKTRLVTVWKSTLAASAATAEVDRWFSNVLKAPVHLVFQQPHQKRETKQARAPGGIVSYADRYPVLFTNTASLDDLNRRIAERDENAAHLPMDRFRPNIVLSGLDAWAENIIQSLDINDMTLKLVKPCTRCGVTTINQELGVRVGKEPLATLALFRQAADGKGVVFGEYGYSLETGHVAVGNLISAHGQKNLTFKPVRA